MSPFFGDPDRFADRADAGRQLAARLRHLRGRPLVVLGLPRGGVVVAYEVATALDAPLDVIVSRKLGAPQQPELAIGAIAGGARVLRSDVIDALGISDAEIDRITAREQARADELERRLRGDRGPLDVSGRVAIVVDDGLATGATALAAVRAVRRRGPERTVLAVPVAPPESVEELRREVDEIVVVHTPRDFRAVGIHYDSFAQVSDDEVEAMLDERATARRASDQPAGHAR
ncbi:MAG: phosphoribosyltransferase [Chloroflexota bacterium]|nr:phosphoribosyltransferase [Chloroflexota bacterium]MDE3194114.1 phosphoribosyltransferase [Chloroflexota bacterium]